MFAKLIAVFRPSAAPVTFHPFTRPSGFWNVLENNLADIEIGLETANWIANDPGPFIKGMLRPWTWHALDHLNLPIRQVEQAERTYSELCDMRAMDAGKQRINNLLEAM